MSQNDSPVTDQESEQNGAQSRFRNVPGQSSLSYRCGTYETFFQAMLKRLANQTDSSASSLANLTTRERNDPAIALLDSWAIVGDVITFYQERIANEGYLRTATEFRSILELARAVGCEFSSGIAASTSLAFTISTTPGSPEVVTIPAGTRVQSVPAQNQKPQTFETIEAIEARAEWNALRPQLMQSQTLGEDTNSLDIEGTSIQLQPGQPLLFLDKNNKIPPELRFLQTVEPDSARNVTKVTWDKQDGLGDFQNVLTFGQQIPIFGYNAPPWQNVLATKPINCLAISPGGEHAITGHIDGTVWLWTIADGKGAKLGQYHTGAVNSVAFSHDYENDRQILSGGADMQVILWILKANFTVQEYFSPPKYHTDSVNSVAFSPNYTNSEGKILSGSGDGTLCLWTLNGDASALENSKPEKLEGHEGAVTSVAFSPENDNKILSGSTDGKLILWKNNEKTDTMDHKSGVKTVAFSPNSDKIFLSGGADKALILWKYNTEKDNTESVRLEGGHTAPVNSVAFSPNYENDRQILSGGVDGNVILWKLNEDFTKLEKPPYILSGHTMSVNGVAYVPDQNEFALSASGDQTLRYWNLKSKQALKVMPDDSDHDWPGFPLSSDKVDLSVTDTKIVKGDKVVLLDQSGDTTNWQLYEVTNVSTVSQNKFSLTAKVTSLKLKLVYIKDEDQNFNRRTTVVLAHSQELTLAKSLLPSCLPSDKKDKNQITLDSPTGLQVGQLLALTGEKFNGNGEQHSEIVALKEIDEKENTLVFEKDLAETYSRQSITLNANIAPATHGETVRAEALGSGDGTHANQRFTLKQKPLTYISAPIASGSQSTLKVWVNHVQWQEAGSLYGLNKNSQNYIVRQDEHGQASVIFGDGKQGLRLPTGEENVVATYRVGTGMVGEVAAGSLTSMQNKPLGLEAVTNPLKASGAAPPDTRDTSRLKAPLTSSTLGRIVSLQDFEDFALTFAGIGRVRVAQLWNGQARVIHLTVLGADQKGIQPNSTLYNSLIKGIDAVREPYQPVVVQSGEIHLFNVTATVLVEPHYQKEPIKAKIESVLKHAFSFENRSFGQDVPASEVIALIQQARGVRAVVLIYLYDIETDKKPVLKSSLPAGVAYWNKKEPGFEAAQLLVINTDGINLTMEEAVE